MSGKTFTLPVLIIGDPQFNDTLTTSLRIDILPYPFVDTSLPDLVVHPGVPFHMFVDNFTLPGTPFDEFALSLAGNLTDNDVPWLTLEDAQTGSNSLLIFGTPPTSQSAPRATVPLVLSATGPDNLTAAATLVLRIVQHEPSRGSPYSAQSVFPKQDRLIVLGVVLPVGLASCLAGLMWWLCVRRRRDRKLRSYNGTHRLSYDNMMDQKSSDRYIQGFGYTTSGKSIPEPEQARTPSLSPSASSRRRSGSIHYYQEVERTNGYAPRRATAQNSIGSVLDISPAYSLQQIQEHSYEHDEREGDYHDHHPYDVSGRTHTPRNRHDDTESNSDLAVERLVEDSTSTPASLAQMPSMNFGFLMSPTVNGRTPESQRVPGGQYGFPRSPNRPPSSYNQPSSRSLRVDSNETSPQMSTHEQDGTKERRRSVNSAYDSLPSFDSESTWAYERRRRPPSPAWRRDDVYRGYTLYDQLKEEEKVKVKEQGREAKAKESVRERGKEKVEVK